MRPGAYKTPALTAELPCRYINVLKKDVRMLSLGKPYPERTSSEMVWVAGFEPAASRFQGGRSRTGLSYTQIGRGSRSNVRSVFHTAFNFGSGSGI